MLFVSCVGIVNVEGDMKARVLRVIEYEGDVEWVNEQILKRSVKGSHAVKGGIIREAIVGEVLTIMSGGDEDETTGSY